MARNTHNNTRKHHFKLTGINYAAIFKIRPEAIKRTKTSSTPVDFGPVTLLPSPKKMMSSSLKKMNI